MTPMTKKFAWSQIFVILKIFEIFNTTSIWHHIWKDGPKLCKKKYFHGDDVIDDVTGRPRNRPSIFPYKWKMNFFHNNWTNNREITITHTVYMYYRIVNMCIYIVMYYVTDDVIRAPNKSKFSTAIALSIFLLEHRSKAQNVTNAYGFLCRIFNFRCHFR